MASPKDENLATLNRRIATAVDAVRRWVPIVVTFAEEWDALVREDPGFASLLWPDASKMFAAAQALNVAKEFLPGYANSAIHQQYMEATKEVDAAEQQLLMAKAVQEGVKEAFANGTMQVAIVEDHTARKGGTGATADQPVIPPDSQ